MKKKILSLILCMLMAASVLPGAALAAGGRDFVVPADAKIGDIVRFGAYEQDNDFANGAEEIEWQVLDIQNGKALLISKYALDTKPYNEETVPVTWETSTLRAWLNGAFLNAAFTAEEQDLILVTTNANPDHPSFGTAGGNDTADRVFLLSSAEANKYFSSNAERVVYPTAYAFAQGCYTCDQETFASYWAACGDEYCETASCWWWLRSPGFHTVYANSVHDNGQVIARSPGSDVRRGDNAVRPALWAAVETASAEAAVPSAGDVGSTFTFGAYEQDNNIANGAEPIEWQVLDVQDGKALVVSKYALDCKPYHENDGHVTWSTSTLRAWLNGEFLQTAFTSAERKSIIPSAVSNPDNAAYGTADGHDTVDRIFLLSIAETLEYFPEMQDRICYPTAYAYARGAYTLDLATKESHWLAWGDAYCETASCWWWQRSIGYNPVFAASVHDDGQLTPSSLGSDVRRSDTSVRPVMWVRLTAEPAASISAQALSVNGAAAECGKYNIDGYNYFRLRDLAALLNGTAAQFSVGFDEGTNRISIVTGEAYEPTGAEFAAAGAPASCAASSQQVLVNGKPANLAAFNIDGSNYFQLRELAGILGFAVDYDAAANMAVITA